MDTQATAPATREKPGIYFVFDGPPGPESGRFVETEDENGRGVGKDTTGAEWRQEGAYWSLGPFAAVVREITLTREDIDVLRFGRGSIEREGIRVCFD
jgi:hypothetical protein